MYASFSDAEGMVAAVGGAIKPLPNHSGIINDYFNANNHLEKPLTDRKTGIVRAVVTANCGFRLAIIRSIHGFDEKTFKNLPPGGEDIDLSYRLRNHGYTLKYGENAIALHEYPNNFMDIVKKFSNYGRGIRVLCKAQKLDPKKIAQPRFNLFSIIKYGILVYKKVAIAYNKFKQHYGLSRVIPYTFFEIVRYYSFGYGYFFKGRTKDLIKT